MGKTVTGLNNIGQLIGNLPETEEPKTVNKYEIASVISYMIGVDEKFMEGHKSEDFSARTRELKENRDATVIRYLCRLRTRLVNNFKKTDDEIRYHLRNIDRQEYYEKEEISRLASWGIQVVMPNYRAEQYAELFNRLIDENIDKCKGLFPDWVNFGYIRDVFVVPGYAKPGVLRAEFNKYQEHRFEYPFQAYIHWKPDGSGINIINSDGAFLHTIYAQHNDTFTDPSKYHDAVNGTKQSIYDFIRQSRKVILTVDCENSDVFKLYGVLKNLDAEETGKIEKIVLYDDAHTSCGWDWLEKFIQIPVEHVEVGRVTDRKSLVDIKMTAGVCRAHYQNDVDSFILCSSDSDFWGLISSMPDARFLVMYENTKCGQAIKDALQAKNIYHCSMDDFYTGNAEELKKKVLLNELKRLAPQAVGQNGKDLAKAVYENTKICAKGNEVSQFYDRYVKTMRLKMDGDGVFVIEVME